MQFAYELPAETYWDPIRRQTFIREDDPRGEACANYMSRKPIESQTSFIARVRRELNAPEEKMSEKELFELIKLAEKYDCAHYWAIRQVLSHMSREKLCFCEYLLDEQNNRLYVRNDSVAWIIALNETGNVALKRENNRPEIFPTITYKFFRWFPNLKWKRCSWYSHVILLLCSDPFLQHNSKAAVSIARRLI